MYLCCGHQGGVYCPLSYGGVKRLKWVIEDMTHCQCIHALAIQLIDVSTHIQQQMDYSVVAVDLKKRQRDKDSGCSNPSTCRVLGKYLNVGEMKVEKTEIIHQLLNNLKAKKCK